MKTEELKKQESIDLEPFYQALEDDSKLLEEAFEILLEMVSTDPKSAKNMAALIKKDFHGLYKEIAELCQPDQDKGNTPSCCGGH
ncbi:hypothetical protein PY092_10835 [Muricauda sp. 334s03]|jgi:hypothetical protein|uniref:Uncharacterized protein n=1 Tax=Flagellimonas yonaguniensis TaxID=3031325 RepID=A0ABT5XZM2_9FLAO|nr:hypothetical protein [[Muricauda] yonaguniensis]MDF0716645.1 hypothetical protein [[Muricauda] yonaguniensis]